MLYDERLRELTNCCTVLFLLASVAVYLFVTLES